MNFKHAKAFVQKRKRNPSFSIQSFQARGHQADKLREEETCGQFFRDGCVLRVRIIPDFSDSWNFKVRALQNLRPPPTSLTLYLISGAAAGAGGLTGAVDPRADPGWTDPEAMRFRAGTT